MPPRKIKVEEQKVQEPIIEEPVKKVKKVRVKKPKPAPIEFVEECDQSVRPATPIAKPKRQSKWINALKEYNKEKSSYLIPKKGTEEYENVRKLMESMSM